MYPIYWLWLYAPQQLIPEPIKDAISSCNDPIVDDISTVTDLNGTTCLSPFPSGRRVFHLDFIVHLSRDRELLKVILVTNVMCDDPFTTLGTRRSSQCGTGRNDGIIYHQCMFLSETTQGDTYHRCLFACTCIGSCGGLFLQQQISNWQGDDTEEYRTCDVKIAP